ncbi:MAG: carboxymuconolactone decarboxylase family protein [Myxococcota bacterium]
MSDSKSRYERGLDVSSTLAGSPEGGRAMVAFFESHGALGDLALRTGAGEIWSREAFSRRDRSLVVISMLTALGRERELQVHIGGGLNHGLSRDEIDEIFVQISAYAGMPVALGAAEVADAVFAARDGTAKRETPPSRLEEKSAEARRHDGLEFLKTLLGQPNLDTAMTEEQILASQGAMGELVIDSAFGEVWTRPQLSRRDRSLIVISVLTALNLKHELEIHIQGALNHGVTKSEVEEMLVTAVLYTGFPRAIDGLIVARKVFERSEAP